MSLNPHFNFTFFFLSTQSYSTASLPCSHDCHLPSVIDFGPPVSSILDLTWKCHGNIWEQAGTGSPTQQAHTALGEEVCVLHGYGPLLQKKQCPQVREIQSCVSKYNEQPSSRQTLGMAFNIFDFYCFHFSLYWLLTIKILRHFLHIFLNHLSSAVAIYLYTYICIQMSSPLAYFFIIFFSIYLSLCPLILFLKKVTLRN